MSPHTAAERADALEAKVRDLTVSLEEMVLRLGEEREALRTRASVDVLERIVLDKRDNIEAMTALYTALRDALAEFGGDGETMGAQVAAVRSAHPDLGERVDRLVTLTRECQQANHDIGVLVSVGLRNASNALDALHGVPADSSADTYDPQGRAKRASGSEFLALRA